jgi:hypothetical protein
MIDGVARQVGSAPNELDPFAVGDLEIYRVDPPLRGYRIIAASKSMWAMRAQCVSADGIVSGPADDPVSTTLYGVANEGLQVDVTTKLPGSADGRSPMRALADIGYTAR